MEQRGSLVHVGLALCAAGFAVLGWAFGLLSPEPTSGELLEHVWTRVLHVASGVAISLAVLLAVAAILSFLDSRLHGGPPRNVSRVH